MKEVLYVSIFLIIFVGVLLFTTIISTPQKNKEEGYYLRDIPYGLGFGGYPPGIYSKNFPYNFYRRFYPWRYYGGYPYGKYV